MAADIIPRPPQDLQDDQDVPDRKPKRKLFGDPAALLGPAKKFKPGEVIDLTQDDELKPRKRVQAVKNEVIDFTQEDRPKVTGSSSKHKSEVIDLTQS
jgi:hypothetical protein